MARLEAKDATTYRDTTTAAASDDSGKNATPTSHGGGDQRMATVIADEEDELFELDIALLDGRDDDHHSCRGHSAAVADDAGHDALLANCLLPARSVSNAVPVAASSMLSSYPYSGYYSSRRLFTGSGRRFLGRPGNSARFCFSNRGFETMGNYFQRY